LFGNPARTHDGSVKLRLSVRRRPLWPDNTQAASCLGRITGAESNNSLKGHRSSHVVGVEFERAAPQRGLEHMTHLLAGAVFVGLDQQSRPFERPQHAG